MKRKDKALYLVLLCITAASFLAPNLFLDRSGDLSLEIRSDGRVIRETALKAIAPGTRVVLREGGGMNELLISGDFVLMISADCPGGDCLKMAPLSSGRGAIVCLPHKLVIKLGAKGKRVSDDDLDAVTY
jgi:hypothetical protein